MRIGSLWESALVEFHSILQATDFQSVVVDTIRPLDDELIIQAAKETGKIVSVEEHYVLGGLGSAVAELLAVKHPTPVRMVGVPYGYAENGPYEELLGKYGLLPHQIAETVKEFVQG